MNVGIVGGGAVGLTAAHDLAVRGADVTLFEKGTIPNEGESTSRAAGVLYDAFAAPEDARVGGRAIERFHEFSGTAGFEFVETPYVWFARTDDEKRAAAIREQVPRMREHGRDVAFIHASELEDRYPALNADDIGVAAIARNTGRTDPGSYARMMAAEAEKNGVEIRTGTEVRVRLDGTTTDGAPRILPDGGHAEPFDVILVAAGAHTKRVLADAGIPVALKPYRVQALTCEFDTDTPMLYDATEGYYLRPHPDGLLAGDGTEEVESDPTAWKHAADSTSKRRWRNGSPTVSTSARTPPRPSNGRGRDSAPRRPITTRSSARFGRTATSPPGGRATVSCARQHSERRFRRTSSTTAAFRSSTRNASPGTRSSKSSKEWRWSKSDGRFSVRLRHRDFEGAGVGQRRSRFLRVHLGVRREFDLAVERHSAAGEHHVEPVVEVAEAVDSHEDANP